MSPDLPSAATLIEREVRDALASGDRRPVVIGLCGSQGSGKSTAAAAVHAALSADDIRAAVLSLDDFYLTAAERRALGEKVHPLLRTRGVPGTHDVTLAMAVLDLLGAGEPARLPRFDKARDDRAPVSEWQSAPAGVEVVLFEGWCVGARPQSDAALREPVNALEAEQDPAGEWRRYVNDQLGGSYQALFARLDRLVLLKAPGFEIVRDWRTQQEQDLRRTAGDSGPAGMTDAEIGTFIQHYERLTRHILAEMPSRADLVVALDRQRSVIAAKHRRPN